jgi:hypothetical protein
MKGPFTTMKLISTRKRHSTLFVEPETANGKSGPSIIRYIPRKLTSFAVADLPEEVLSLILRHFVRITFHEFSEQQKKATKQPDLGSIEDDLDILSYTRRGVEPKPMQVAALVSLGRVGCFDKLTSEQKRAKMDRLLTDFYLVKAYNPPFEWGEGETADDVPVLVTEKDVLISIAFNRVTLSDKPPSDVAFDPSKLPSSPLKQSSDPAEDLSTSVSLEVKPTGQKNLALDGAAPHHVVLDPELIEWALDTEGYLASFAKLFRLTTTEAKAQPSAVITKPNFKKSRCTKLLGYKYSSKFALRPKFIVYTPPPRQDPWQTS